MVGPFPPGSPPRILASRSPLTLKWLPRWRRAQGSWLTLPPIQTRAGWMQSHTS